MRSIDPLRTPCTRGATAVLASLLAAPALSQLTIVTNQPGTFVDISATGTPLSLSDDEEIDIQTTIGNALLPAGVVRVGSNGCVRFRGTGLQLGYINGPLPSASVFSLTSQALLPFWDDVNTSSGTFGEIYWQETAGMLIVQWHDVAFFNSPVNQTARFQLQVPSTGSAWARFVYADIVRPRPNGGESATIGYQSAGWGNDVQFSLDTAGAVMDGSVLTLTGPFTPPPPPSLSIVDNLPGTWIDIAATGTPLGLADDAAVDIQTTVGNALLSAGVVRVGSNGAIRFDGTGQSLGFTNANLPSSSVFGLTSQSLVPFWDDIDTDGGQFGEIYWQEVSGRLIVQWEAAAFYNGSATSDTVTFQVQVPSSGPALAQFLYEDVSSQRANGGGSATIGYQSGGPPNENDVEWSFNVAGSVANGTVLSLVSGGGTVGTGYCQVVPNSTGQMSLLTATGSAVVASNDLQLRASQLPPNAFGYFLVSQAQGFVVGPGGSRGNLCLGGSIGRYVGPGFVLNSGAAGEFALTVDLTRTPTPTGLVAVAPGETWHFQSWHRDLHAGAPTSNFTNGLSVAFH